MTRGITRREALQAAAGLGALAVGASLAEAQQVAVGRASSGDERTAGAAPARRRVARFAHITDAHVNGEKGSDRGLAQCFQHIRALQDPVDFILNTGDTVMCVNKVDAASANRQWDVWSRTAKAENRLPLFSVLGNHDSWGWEAPTPETPLRGKGQALDVLEMPGRFYRFERGGWSLIVLDSIFGGYTGRLDPPQREWLAAELARIPAAQPVCIATHIPIITACGLFDGERFGPNGWTVPGSWMHEDARDLKDQFLKHRNVKLCLSGHMHQVDRIDFNGVSYICGGAVSASWWDGKYYECDHGYSAIDLFEDGGFEQVYIPFGWRS